MRMLLSGLLLVVSAQAWAGNAGWYRWESKIEHSYVCAQTSPGEGWKRIAGPFREATCSQPR